MNPLDEWVGSYIRSLEPGYMLTEQDVAVLRYILALFQLRDPEIEREHRKHAYRWWRDMLKEMYPDRKVDWIVQQIAEKMDVSPAQVFRWIGGRKR